MTNTYYNYGENETISADIETYDPFLKDKGSGVYRKDGYIIGVSFSNGKLAEYYPLRHPDTSPEERIKNEAYIKDTLKKPSRKIWAGGLYDLDWLVNSEEYSVNGDFDDVLVAEPLINEYRPAYNLDSVSKLYLAQGKEYDGIKQYADDKGWKTTDKDKGISNLWRMPQHIAKMYAATDPLVTYLSFMKQHEILKEQDLLDVYSLEMGQWPLLLQMRKNGVRIDADRLTRTGEEIQEIECRLQKEMNSLAGFDINVGSNKDMERLFISKGIALIYKDPTDKMRAKGKMQGNPSFDQKVLGRINHPTAKKALALKHVKTLLSTFLRPYPEFLANGRFHCNFHQLRTDDFGTITGRYSSSKPNLQNVSAKDEEDYVESDSGLLTGRIIRRLFLPEEEQIWQSDDWSQIEYRLIAHYAVGPGADHIRQRYNENPATDYHSEIGDMTGIAERKKQKNMNFGSGYGMGPKTMSEMFGWSLEEAQAMYTLYHEKVPFIKETSRLAASVGRRRGYILTILKRHCRMKAKDKAHLMFNKLIQGSAADMMKKAMMEAHKAGVFNTLTPHMTVHDELDVSRPLTREGEEASKELKYIMENSVKIHVPVKVKVEEGPNWADLEEVK